MSTPANDSPYAFGERIEQVVAHHARVSPHAVAVQQGGRSLTYRELTARSETVAAALSRLGVEPGRHVAVRVPRSPELVTTLLGVLRAGASYVAIDPQWPQGRVDETLRGTDAALCVTEAPGAPTAPPGVEVRTVTFASLLELGRTTPAPAPLHDGTATASVFYTSGSTGKPKGVLSPHKGTIRTLVNCPAIPLGPDSVFLQAAPLPWDGLSLELWAPLLNGGRCVLMDRAATALDAPGLEAAIRQGVNSLWLTSSLFNVLAEERIDLFGAVRLLLVGGERVSVSNARRVITEFPALHVVNGYGPVESTIFATAHVIRPTDVAAGSTEVPIGAPVPRTVVALLGADGRPVADGDLGEMAVAGDGVALGYAGAPEETARRFFTRDGVRFYRTGDLAVRDTEGLLRYRGRTDHQFKIRGVRIEAGEVEAVLEDHPEVAACCVVPLETAPGRVQLAAAYTTVHQQPLDEVELTEHAARSLLGAMVPTRLAHAVELPRNANGKADRKAVEALLRGSAGPAGVAARRPAQGSPVLDDVHALLGLAHLAEDDDLVMAGATSLDVIRLAARVGARLDARLTASDVYRLRTPRAITAHCSQAAPREQLPSPGPDRTAPAPLSRAQQRFWLAEMSTPGAADNMIVLAYALTGPLRRDLLQAALDDVVEAHPALRTIYPWVDEAPQQQVLAPADAAVVLADIAGPATGRMREAAEAVTADWWAQPFSLEDEVPLRARLCRLAEDRHLLCFHVHHIAFDGWSESVLIADLARAYTARSEGRRHEAAATLSYGEFSAWEATRLADWARRDLPFWKEELAAVPEPFLPAPARTGAGPADRLERVMTVDAQTVRRLEQAAAGRGGPALAALLAGAAAALARTFDAAELTVGSVTAGRFDPALEPVVGYFVNPFALVVSPAHDDSAGDLLDRATVQVVSRLQHAHTPFDELVRVLTKRRGRHPFFQTWVVLQGLPPHGNLGGHVAVEPVRVRPPSTDTELTLEAVPAPDGSWDLVVAWRADGVTAAQAEQLLAELHTALGETADCA
ncbi:non-ribosomal peptide synthetase [Streptomyces spiramenti]|uniref:Amino acid adenylation domain-containing protein n=1 Tax=Streptomyces spiramenti TaxID=2720606 RepID=A0ABX1ANR8_9ACTN|nr:non-ribosomal peptide synthetase [Streptomyces spiramenti]NJP67063.1 amino acid adenylation domain-containing protein [Streptomyces spiramenti]